MKRGAMHTNNIKMILKEKDMTQQELADIALNGYTSHLSKIINGKKQHVSLEVALKICKALNKNVEDVFTLTKKNKL